MADTGNLGQLLRHVHRSGTVSRAELAERMGLNRSTIMALTAELSAAGAAELGFAGLLADPLSRSH